MRTIECDVCGEPVTAADDEELARNLAAHLKRDHGEEPGEEAVAEQVAAEAYDATDS